MSKMSLTEATMLAIQGKLVETKKSTKRIVKETKVNTTKVDNLIKEYFNHKLDLTTLHTKLNECFKNKKAAIEYFANNSKRLKLEAKKLKKENIDINVDDKTNVSVIGDETVVDTESATIIVDKKDNEIIPEISNDIITTEPETVEIPVEGNETIIPEDLPETDEVSNTMSDDDLSIIKPSIDNELNTDVDLPLDTNDEDDDEKNESKKVESKKLNENIEAAPFRNMIYQSMVDGIDSPETIAERLMDAWSDDDCKWYCETYELVEPHKDYSDENHYYKDLWGNIRDVSGQVVDDEEELEEAKHRKIESIKKIENRIKNSKKLNEGTKGYSAGICPKCGKDIVDYDEVEWFDDSIGYPFTCSNCGVEGMEYYTLTFDEIELKDGLDETKHKHRVHNKKVENNELHNRNIKTQKHKIKFNSDYSKCDTKSFTEALKKFYIKNDKVVESVNINRVYKVNNTLKIEANLTLKNKQQKQVCLEMKQTKVNNKFTKYSLQENKQNKQGLTMLTYTNKNNIVECRYINKV